MVLACCAIGQGVGAWLESWLRHDYAFRVIAELRTLLVAVLDRLAPAWRLGRRTGDVGAMVMSDVERTEWLYAHVLPNAIVAALVPTLLGGTDVVTVHPVRARNVPLSELDLLAELAAGLTPAGRHPDRSGTANDGGTDHVTVYAASRRPAQPAASGPVVSSRAAPDSG
ncbi:hypothetical protein ACU61A_25040 [Pseudonocardia sichuanensis]|uniref:hypothetical protein n=1 Tax=Pseudonocardia kunmingensis TaxID=630975 RepID=UPI001152AC66|nr:hypothetical protein [Pseudonocardia kunmingensis]